MRLHYLISLFICCILLSGCTARKPAGAGESLPATALAPYGRTIVNNNGELELISSGAHFSFSFEGRECRIRVSIPSWLSHNYLQYELDGAYAQRVRVTGKSPETIIIVSPDDGPHTVRLFKATEAHTGPIRVHGISGKKVQALQPPRAPLIEFIGNSITCGAAADPSEVPCGTGQYHDQHNAYLAYGPRVARALGAHFLLSSVSGIGVYRNWNSDGPAMPEVYEKSDFRAGSGRHWDFTLYQPDIVSIALGTNDFSRGDGKTQRLPFDSAKFVSSYIAFVQQVKGRYPGARIALLSSAMLNGSSRTLLQNCLLAVKEKADGLYPGSRPVALHFFQPMQARGCTGHPSVEDHGILAQELIPFFRKLLQ